MSEEKVLDSQGREYPHPTDSTDEVFYEWLNTASIGDVTSTHNLLCQCFNQLKDVKDELVMNIRTGKFNKSAEKQATEKLSKEVYPMLQRLETRIFKCRDRIRVIERKPMKIPPS